MVSKTRILLVDDEATVHQTLGGYLENLGMTVVHAYDGESALGAVREIDCQMAFVDVRMPGLDGLMLLSRFQEEFPELAAVIITAHGDMDTAIEALRLGAVDFLPKPLKLREVDGLIAKARRVHELRASQRSLHATIAGLRHTSTRASESGFVGVSAASRTIRKEILHAALSGCDTVLITGETGTGKEVVAREIHREANPREAPFVAVSCPAMPDTLVESELFGHTRGAFTGATADRAGYFSLADGGTLFLDEVGDLSPNAQAVFLRVLETRSFRPVGGAREVSVRVRVIAATNVPIDAHRSTGKFRQDLYYRLNVFRIHLPPLRERVEDIMPLVESFLAKMAAKGNGQARSISAEARATLERYPYPGNVRELQALVERAVIRCDGTLIEARHLALPDSGIESVRPPRSGRPATGAAPPEHGSEKERILHALEDARWNRRRAAAELGLPYSTFRYRLLKLGIH